jgi:uncharacterized membrane protein
MNEVIESGYILSDMAKQEISKVGKWAKYIAITGFIICGLIVLFGVFAGVILIAFYSFGAENSALNLPSLISVPIYLLLTALCFVPCLKLYNFSIETKEAIQSGSDGTLTEAFTNLHKCFKFVGIITITALGLYALIRIGIGISYISGLLFGD